MPRIQADNVAVRKSPVTREQVLAAKEAHPDFNRHQLATLLGCSEQTIQRRTENNNVRGGKYKPQTRVQLVGGLIDQWATDAGFFLYDRRAWVKDPCWANSRWHAFPIGPWMNSSTYMYFGSQASPWLIEAGCPSRNGVMGITWGLALSVGSVPCCARSRVSGRVAPSDD